MNGNPSPQWLEEEWLKDILREQTEIRSHSLINLADKLEHTGDFPTTTPPKLCRLVKNISININSAISNIPDDKLSHVNLVLCQMTEHLRYIERSRIAHIPWSLIQSTEQFLKYHVGNNCHFIIRPQWSFNYSIIGEFVEAYKTLILSMKWISQQKWDDAFQEFIKDKIYCIAFPRIERLNALMHSIWGHELGHIIADQWITKHFDTLWRNNKSKIINRIEQYVKMNPPPSDPLFKIINMQQRISELENNTMEATKQGLKELICDAVGVHLLGPATLAATCEFSATYSLDESPLKCDMYPPWRYRLRLMAKACKNDFQKQTVKVNDTRDVEYPCTIIKPFWEWIRGVNNLGKFSTDSDILRKDITTREAYNLIDNEWDRIRTQALNFLQNKPSKPYHLFEHVHTIQKLVKKLEQDIPPNELGDYPDNRPSSLEDILNAAWVFKIKKKQENEQKISPTNLNKLYRLVLKGVEASFVHQFYGDRLKELEKE